MLTNFAKILIIELGNVSYLNITLENLVRTRYLCGLKYLTF